MANQHTPLSDDETPGGSPRSAPDGPPPPLSEAFDAVFRRIAYRTRNGLRRVVGRGRDHLERRQSQRDLEHFWTRLGKTAYHLVEAGELDHPALRKAMARIDDLQARIAAGDAPEAEPMGASTEDDAIP